MATLKNSRSGHKGNLTRISNEIKELMTDTKNVDMVKDHLKQYELALEEFMKSHIEYHKTLTVSEEITESNDYALSVESDADRLRQRVVKFI